MKAAVPEDLLALLGIQVSPGTVAAASRILEQTMPSLEAMLESELSAADREDYFTLGSRDVSPVLRLHTGFVDSSSPVVLTNVGSVVDSSDYVLDPYRGVVHVNGTLVTGTRCLSVSYSSGFPESTDIPGLLEELPSGVVGAALSLAAAYYLLNPNNAPRQKASHLSSIGISGFESSARRAVEPFQRPRATVIWPDYSVRA